MKKSLFRPGNKYFHIVIDFQTHPLLKDLDWIYVQKKIRSVQIAHESQVHVLLMMDTHIHLLICSAQQKENFFCEALRSVLNLAQTTNDCHCEPILNYQQYLNAYKYILRNPVEAGIVSHVEGYPYSSLRLLLGKSVPYCEVLDHLGLIQNPIQRLRWLNNFQDYQFSKLTDFMDVHKN